MHWEGYSVFILTSFYTVTCFVGPESWEMISPDSFVGMTPVFINERHLVKFESCKESREYCSFAKVINKCVCFSKHDFWKTFQLRCNMYPVRCIKIMAWWISVCVFIYVINTLLKTQNIFSTQEKSFLLHVSQFHSLISEVTTLPTSDTLDHLCLLLEFI